MAQLNENLIRAMVWDLKEVVDVSVTLSSWVGKVDCMSWRFPSQQSQSVNVLSIFSQLSGTAGEYYVNLLEFIYDRLLLILNLLVKFVDNFPNVLIDFHMAKNVIRPQNLSLGGLLNIFWTRMQSLQNCMINFMATQSCGENFQENGIHQEKSASMNISHTVVSRNCQTDIISLASCENCHLSEELMRKIIKWVESTSLDVQGKSAVATMRQAMAEEVLHVTQWRSVSRWSEAIVQDLVGLLAAFKDASNANASLTKLVRTTHEQWREKCNGHRQCVKDLGNQCKELHENLVQTENKLRLANEQCRQTVSEKENNYKILEKKMKLIAEMLAESEAKEKSTESALTESQRQITTLVDEKTDLANRVAELRSILEVEQRERAADLAKATNLQAENTELRNSVARLTQKVSDLAASKVVCPEKLGGNVAKDLGKSEGQNVAKDLGRSEGQAKLEGKTQNAAKDPANLEASKEIRGQRLQGNPMKDMLGQIQANELGIERLQKENARIAKTLHKLQAFNAKKATTEKARVDERETSIGKVEHR